MSPTSLMFNTCQVINNIWVALVLNFILCITALTKAFYLSVQITEPSSPIMCNFFFLNKCQQVQWYCHFEPISYQFCAEHLLIVQFQRKASWENRWTFWNGIFLTSLYSLQMTLLFWMLVSCPVHNCLEFSIHTLSLKVL